MTPGGEAGSRAISQFNTREGQCPTCRGLGGIDLDVQYLPDITVPCPTCHCARFNDATLAVRVDGLTIADVLALTVDDALDLLAAADHLIDMGPDAGPDGGHIIAVQARPRTSRVTRAA